MEIAALYRSVLQGANVEIPLDDPRDERVYHLFVVYVERRDAVRAALQARGVHTAIHYPRPVPLQPAFAALGFGPGSFPHAERACERALSMPFFPEMTDEQVQYAAQQLAEVVGGT
jgi:dTDP-4-amino-4,6-dideoxygalactose transaminase